MSGSIDSGAIIPRGVYNAPSGQPAQVQGAQVINGQIPDSLSSGTNQTTTNSASTPTSNVVSSNPQLATPNNNLVDNDLTHTLPAGSSAPATAASATTGGDKPPPTAEVINQAYDAAFDKAVEGKPDENALRFAHYNSPPGTPMTALEKQAFEQVVLQYGITSQEFTPTPVKKDFMEEVAFAFDDEFVSLLQNQKPPLSKDEIAKLKYMHFNPGSTFKGSDDPKLQAQLKSLENQATGSTETKFGIPLKSDGTPAMPISANTKMYNAMLNGFYQNFVDTNTTNFLNSGVGAQMSAADQQSLKAYLKDPSTPVSETVKAAASQIISQSTAQVISNQNLQGIGFVPAPFGTFPPVNPVVNAFINMVKQVMGDVQKVINALPSTGPNAFLKVQYQNILAAISEALQRFEETVYASQSISSSKAKEASDAKLSMALDQIKKNGASAAEAKSKAAKMAEMSKLGGLIMAIVTVIMILIAIVVTICTLGAAGPEMFIATVGVIGAVGGAVGGAIGAGVTVGATEGVIAGVMAAIEAIVNAIIEAVVTIVENVIQQVVSAVVKLIMQSVIREAVKNAIKTVSESSIKAIVKAIVEGVVEALKGLAQSVDEIGTALKDVSMESIKKAVTEAVEGVLKGIEGAIQEPVATLEKILDGILQLVKSIAKDPSSIMKAGEIVQGAGDIAQGGLSMAQNSIKAQLAIMKANMDSEQTLSDAELKNLSKLIQQLLALLSGQSDLIQYIGTTQTSMTKKASQTITAISAA